jgi:hypothetical protein
MIPEMNHNQSGLANHIRGEDCHKPSVDMLFGHGQGLWT